MLRMIFFLNLSQLRLYLRSGFVLTDYTLNADLSLRIVRTSGQDALWLHLEDHFSTPYLYLKITKIWHKNVKIQTHSHKQMSQGKNKYRKKKKKRCKQWPGTLKIDTESSPPHGSRDGGNSHCGWTEQTGQYSKPGCPTMKFPLPLTNCHLSIVTVAASKHIFPTADSKSYSISSNFLTIFCSFAKSWVINERFSLNGEKASETPNTGRREGRKEPTADSD